MGRRRKSQTFLPLRWEHSHGAYYYRVPEGQRQAWDGKAKFRLGATLAEAFTTWYGRVEPETIRTIGQAMDRYVIEVLPELAPKTQRDYRRKPVEVAVLMPQRRDTK